jgi:hypothetical protein
MTGLQTGKSAQDFGYQAVQTIVQRITYLTALTTVITDLQKKLPAYAHLVSGGVHVVTAFNDSGTDTLDVGFRGGSSTDDPDGYATLLDLSAVGFIAFDELAAITNIMQTKDTFLTARYNGQNSNASAGDAYLVFNYVVGGP